MPPHGILKQSKGEPKLLHVTNPEIDYIMCSIHFLCRDHPLKVLL